MEITTLIENSRLDTPPGLVAEHGLSLHIDTGKARILFDTGASDAFAANAQQLDVAVEQVGAMVLSHHHYDHGGGLARFLDMNASASAYMKPVTHAAYAFRALGVVKKSIGLDPAVLAKHPDRFSSVDTETEIAEGVTVITDMQHPHPLPGGNKKLFAVTADGLEPDSFDHELMMVVDDDDGIVVFTGCAHNGILNMMETAVSRFPQRRIKAVLGGFHLVGIPFLNTMAHSRAEVVGIAEKLDSYDVDMIYTGHCTGPKAFGVMKEVLGDRLEAMPAGTRITV